MTEEQMKKIQDYYKILCNEAYGGHRDEYCNFQAITMKEVLDILELKVKGVNSFVIEKEDLDTRICDVMPYEGDTETYREFITNIEKEFGFDPAPIDTFTTKELNEYVEEMKSYIGK